MKNMGLTYKEIKRIEIYIFIVSLMLFWNFWSFLEREKRHCNPGFEAAVFLNSNILPVLRDPKAGGSEIEVPLGQLSN